MTARAGIRASGVYLPRATQACRDRGCDGGDDRDGALPCQTDGGLKCFGHPVGASGLRMEYEIYTQLLGRAGERQVSAPSLGLTHNLGGMPNRSVASVAILGLHGIREVAR